MGTFGFVLHNRYIHERRGDIPFPPYSNVVEEVKHGMHNGVTLPNDSNRVAGVTRFDKKAPRIIWKQHFLTCYLVAQKWNRSSDFGSIMMEEEATFH